MHEATIVDGLMRILIDRAKQHGIDRIAAVRVVVGRLRGLDTRQIRGCFEIFAEGTVADGARLDIVEVEVSAQCRGCGRRYAVSGFRFECRSCGGSDADVISGRELHIESFDGQAGTGGARHDSGP